MNFNLNDRTVFLTLAGSHAYGFSTPQSDFDYRGIVIAPMGSYVGLESRFEQIVDNQNKTVWKYYPPGLVEPEADMQVMELTKFCRLAAQCNPSVIENLFTPEEVIIRKDPIMTELLAARESFLSRQAKARFCGYALSQLNRIKRHKRWLDNPPTSQPTRLEFGLPEYKIISLDELGAAEALIEEQVKEFSINQDDLPEHVKIELENAMERILKTIWTVLGGNKQFPIGRYQDYHRTEDVLFEAMASKLRLDENFIELLKREKRYRTAKNEWNSYQKWLTERNPARAELEKKFGYDCHVEETEFLTNNGWKKFDDISIEDKLATINPDNFTVEYQQYKEKFDSLFTGNLYWLYGNHLDVRVTPNHRMFSRKVERKNNKKYDWGTTTISNLPDTFEILRYPTAKKKNYSVKKFFPTTDISNKNYLKLMGWFLSDGTVSFRKNVPRAVVISQKHGGKLHDNMKEFFSKHKDKRVSLYEYTRKPNLFRTSEINEVILSVRNKNIVNKMVAECGVHENKRIPRWVMSLSKDMMDTLLNALIDGDGTKCRPDKSIIYYSSLPNLANDVQELALLCGYETSLYGPYVKNYNGTDVNMYHVHVNKTRSQFKRCVRSKNIRKISVVNKRTVCFSVPNDTLITRLNGHVAIQRNCKHAAHLVRLIRMCREILETGQVLVKRPDADQIKAIRAGAWTYEKICEYAEAEDKDLQFVAAKSKLPTTPDMNKIHELVFSMVMRYNFGKCDTVMEEQLRTIINSLLLEPQVHYE